MTTRTLKFTSETNLFGTTVKMATDDGEYTATLAIGLSHNPLANLTETLESGYLFRNPTAHNSNWQTMLDSLEDITGAYTMVATVDDKNRVYSMIRFAEKTDAGPFAWSNVEDWQKWSDELELADAEERENRGKPLKAEVDADGKVTVKVKVSKLGD